MTYQDIVNLAIEIIQEVWDSGSGDAIDFTCNVVNMTSVSLSLQTDHDVDEDEANEAAFDACSAPQFADWINE